MDSHKIKLRSHIGHPIWKKGGDTLINLPGVKRMFELNIQGVRMSDRMDFTPHINYVTTAAVQYTYARVLRAHGLSGPNLWDVTRATVVAKLTYACSAWWGYVDSGGKARIQSVLNKLKRLGFFAEYISFDQKKLYYSHVVPRHILTYWHID